MYFLHGNISNKIGSFIQVNRLDFVQNDVDAFFLN